MTYLLDYKRFSRYLNNEHVKFINYSFADSYSSKEDDSQGSISNQKTDGDDILELFQSHSNDDKLDMQHSSFQCNVCHKIFAENKILKRHLKIHNPNKPHVCGVCSMSFAESSNLTKHMKKHTGRDQESRW